MHSGQCKDVSGRRMHQWLNRIEQRIEKIKESKESTFCQKEVGLQELLY